MMIGFTLDVFVLVFREINHGDGANLKALVLGLWPLYANRIKSLEKE